MRIDFSPDDLRPLVEAVVAETIAKLDADRQRLGGERFAFPEREAAALLGVAPHVLRDIRLRQEGKASRIGRKVVWTKAELERLLKQNRL